VSEKNLNTTWLINAKRKEVEGRTGLRFSWVKTSEELTGVLKEGLTELYQQVYADPPYNEAFSPEDVRKVFKKTLSVGGLILTAACPDDGRTVAFITSVPMAAAEPLVSDVINAIIPPGTASYFSEEGVARDWRRRGLSTNMKDLLLTANFLSGFENIVLRTSVYNYPQIAAINKSGGIVIPNLFQMLKAGGGDGSIITDKRAFYLFNREWTDQAENLRILNRVTIVRPGATIQPLSGITFSAKTTAMSRSASSKHIRELNKLCLLSRRQKLRHSEGKWLAGNFAEMPHALLVTLCLAPKMVK